MNIEKLKLVDLKAGDTVSGVVLVSSSDVAKTNAGAEFVKGEVSDGKKKMAFKKWQASESDKTDLSAGKGIMIVSGSVTEYQGTLEIKLTKYSVLPETEMAMLSIVPESDIPVAKLEESWAYHVDALKAAGYQMDELAEFLNKAGLLDAYKTYAGAMSMHHDYKFGLLEHVTNTASIALDMCRHVPYVINVNAIRFAALFHDLGKISCYNFANCLAVELSPEGLLTGHLFVSAAIIGKLRKFIPAEDYSLIVHCVLAHHDNPEWGAVVPPATMEAQIVAMADLLSSRIPVFAPVNEVKKPVYSKNMNRKILV